MGTLIDRFNRSLSLADLSGSLAIGVFIGYERQRLADSGELIPEKIIASIMIASQCFSSNFFPFSSNAERAPQLKASVGQNLSRRKIIR
jgi:hypothetical protein